MQTAIYAELLCLALRLHHDIRGIMLLRAFFSICCCVAPALRRSVLDPLLVCWWFLDVNWIVSGRRVLLIWMALFVWWRSRLVPIVLAVGPVIGCWFCCDDVWLLARTVCQPTAVCTFICKLLFMRNCYAWHCDCTMIFVVSCYCVLCFQFNVVLRLLFDDACLIRY